MSKYIIEIEDWPVNGLYKAKGFKTLVFDEEGLRRLEKVEDETQCSYYYISDQMTVCMAKGTDSEVDKARIAAGNYFHSDMGARIKRDGMLDLLKGKD